MNIEKNKIIVARMSAETWAIYLREMAGKANSDGLESVFHGVDKLSERRFGEGSVSPPGAEDSPDPHHSGWGINE